MNQVAKIEIVPAVPGRIFNPRLTTAETHAPMELLRAPLGESDLEWHTTPPRLIDGLKFASRFIGRPVYGLFKEWTKFVHVANGKAYATDGIILVEYDVGASGTPYVAHDKREIALINSFGEHPSEVATVIGKHYRWTNGSRLTLPGQEHAYISGMNGNADLFHKKFDEFDWTGLHTVDDAWRAQVVGQLSYKSGEEVFAHITNDRIVSGVDKDETDFTQMNIETPIDGEASIYKDQFVAGIKLAEKMKFEHQTDLTVMLITAEKIRAVVVGGRPQEPVSDLS